MHIALLVLLVILTFPYWFPVAVFGYAAFVLCFIAVALPFMGIRWIYRRAFPPADNTHG